VCDCFRKLAKDWVVSSFFLQFVQFHSFGDEVDTQIIDIGFGGVVGGRRNDRIG
jgi:hypothetical protein